MCFSIFVHIFPAENVPKKWLQDRAQSFGLWGIAGFIGSCLGPLVTGGVLWLFPGRNGKDSAIQRCVR